MQNHFASNLKYLRSKNNYTYQQLSDKSNCSINAIRFWEIGEREPNAQSAYNIATAFGYSIDDFLRKDLRFDDLDSIDKEAIIESYKIDRELSTKMHNLSDDDKKMFLKMVDSIIERDKK